MGKEEEKPVLGYQRSEYFYPTQPQFYQTQPQFYQTQPQFYQTNPLCHQMHLPGYVEPCPGYPNNLSVQQPFQYYEYNYPARPLPYVSPDISQGFSFGRVVLCLMFFLVAFVLIISTFTMFIFMTLKPTFHLESFEVRSFNISGNGRPGTTLKANWDTKLSVKNTNHRSSVLLKHVETTLVYRYVAIDMSTMDHVEVQKESSVQILDAFSFPNSRRSFNVESVASEMAKDRMRGQIMFDLKLDVLVMVKSNVFQKSDKMRLYCERITLNFKNSSSSIPTWDGSKNECISGF